MSVAIDNSKNVFFQFTNWEYPTGNDFATNCIFKATANSSSKPTAWGIAPIVYEGQNWTDGETGAQYRISSLQLHYLLRHHYDSSSLSAFSHKDLNRTPILGNSIGRDS